MQNILKNIAIYLTATTMAVLFIGFIAASSHIGTAEASSINGGGGGSSASSTLLTDSNTFSGANVFNTAATFTTTGNIFQNQLTVGGISVPVTGRVYVGYGVSGNFLGSTYSGVAISSSGNNYLTLESANGNADISANSRLSISSTNTGDAQQLAFTNAASNSTSDGTLFLWNAPNQTGSDLAQFKSGSNDWLEISSAGLVTEQNATTSLLTVNSAAYLNGTTTTRNLNGVITVTGFPYAKTSAGIQQALSLCGTNGIGGVFLAPGTYTINSRSTPVNNCHVFGAGKGVTVLQGSVAFDWVFYYSSSTAPLVNFSITDLTCDLQNGSNAGCIEISNSSSTEVSRVSFLNGAAGGWFLNYATPVSATTTIYNYNNKAIDDDFTSHAGSLEALLVTNSENMYIGHPVLDHISSPGIGLWQADYDTRIDNFYCTNSSNGQIYYNITVDRTTINSPNFNNCGAAIVGAGTSDNGAFGVSRVQGLKITNPIIVGGANSSATNAIELGSVNDATVINPLISGYGASGIAVTQGDENASSSPTNWSIIGGTIKNNNQANSSPSLHPGIYISTSTPSGANENGLISGVNIYDDQVSPTQEYPISFNPQAGAIQFDGITITGNQLNAPSSLGGTSITLQNGATLGPLMQIYSNSNYTGTNPKQAFYINNNVLLSTQATTTMLSAYSAYFGGTATSTFSSTGALTISSVTSPGIQLTVSGGRSVLSGNSDKYALGVKYVSSGGAVYFGAQSNSANPDASIFNNAGTSLMTLQNAGQITIDHASKDSITIPLTPGLTVDDNTALAQGDGGGIAFRGIYTGSSLTQGAAIAAYKENATDGNFAFALAFYTRVNGGNNTEKMRITSTGNVGIGTTTPTATLTSQLASSTLTTASAFDVWGLMNTVIWLFQRIDEWGHRIVSGPAPTCTTNCSIVSPSNDNAMRIITGSGVTSEVVTFAHAWSNIPICQAQEELSGATAAVTASSTLSTITISNASLTSINITVTCVGTQ